MLNSHAAASAISWGSAMAWVAELTGDVLDGWPRGMRLIVRKERPHPGAQLRLTDADGMRLTCFATNTVGWPIAELELRHRLRARAEDRIQAARATGLRNLPLHHTARNKVWLEIVQIALDLLAWMPMLALTGKARLWELRRLRFRLFSAAGQLVTPGGSSAWPGTGLGLTASPPPSTGSPFYRTPTDQRIPRPYERTHQPEQWKPAFTRDDTRALNLPHPQPTARKQSTDSVGGRSRKIEARGAEQTTVSLSVGAVCSRRDGPVVLLSASGAAGGLVAAGSEQHAAADRAAPAGADLLPVQHPCAAWPMQMLRCTRDTALLPPKAHHQDHEQHPGDDRAAHRAAPCCRP